MGEALTCVSHSIQSFVRCSGLSRSTFVPKSDLVEKRYRLAREQFEAIGVDTENALKRLRTVPISVHCWQGDDVGGFERVAELGGGLAVTGNYPGKARTADELRADLEKAYSLIPGKHRLNLHAIYGDFSG